jgi:hypothetical protein
MAGASLRFVGRLLMRYGPHAVSDKFIFVLLEGVTVIAAPRTRPRSRRRSRSVRIRSKSFLSIGRLLQILNSCSYCPSGFIGALIPCGKDLRTLSAHPRMDRSRHRRSPSQARAHRLVHCCAAASCIVRLCAAHTRAEIPQPRAIVEWAYQAASAVVSS